MHTINASRQGRQNRDLRQLRSPDIIIGDVHGCWYTLLNLLDTVGIDPHTGEELIVSVGDLHDKGGCRANTHEGPAAAGSVRVLRWAIEQTDLGRLCVVDSNHGQALARRIQTGNRAKPSVEETYEEIVVQHDAATLVPQVRSFLSSRPAFARFSGGPQGEIVVAHAGVAERLLDQRKLRPEEERYSILAREYRWTGQATAVVGHVRTAAPARISGPGGDLLRIDTGCGEPGGKLSAWLPQTDTFVTVEVDPRDLRS